MATPLSTMKKTFDSKDKLVEAVTALMTEDLWLPRLSKDRGGSKDLSQVSNKKLLRLHTVLTAVQKEFKTRGKLIAALLELEGRGKDESYKTRLEGYPVPRLYDAYKAAQRRSKRSAKAPAKAAPAEKPAAKKKTAKAKTAAK